MIITISKFLAEEAQHKIGIVWDEPELQESYNLTEDQVGELFASVPSCGGEWDIPEWGVALVLGEMEDEYPIILRKINHPAPKQEPAKKEYNINLGHIRHVYNDGGRRDAGYKGDTGDCVVRAISIATGISYKEVYDELFKRAVFHQKNKRDKVAKYLKKTGRSQLSPRTGVHRKIYEPYLESLGWKWVAVSGIGVGCKMHLHQNEIPDGTIIFRVSHHLTCTKDKVLHDTYDCTRNGSRMVYGYYQKVS